MRPGRARDFPYVVIWILLHNKIGLRALVLHNIEKVFDYIDSESIKEDILS